MSSLKKLFVNTENKLNKSLRSLSTEVDKSISSSLSKIGTSITQNGVDNRKAILSLKGAIGETFNDLNEIKNELKGMSLRVSVDYKELHTMADKQGTKNIDVINCQCICSTGTTENIPIKGEKTDSSVEKIDISSYLGKANKFADGLAKMGKKYESTPVSPQRDVSEDTSTNDSSDAPSPQNSLEKIKSFGNSMAGIGSKLTANITKPLVKLGTDLAQSAIDSENAFSGVKESLDATPEELKRIKKEFDNMSLSVPRKPEDIYNIGKKSAQKGIKAENITGFSEVVVKLDSVTNLSEDDAIGGLADFTSTFETNMDNIGRLGSTIAYLDKNLAATGKEIVNMGVRLADIGSQIGLTESEVMAFSGAITSIGIDPSAGEKALRDLMTNMNSAASGEGKGLAQFASVSGLNPDDFANLFQSNASEALLAFIEGLGKLEQSGGNASSVLEELGFKEMGVKEALLQASSSSDLFRESLNLGSEAWNKNNALNDMAAAKYEGLGEKVQLAKNHLGKIKTDMGNLILDSFLDKANGLMGWFDGLSDGTKKTIVNLGIFAATMGPVLLGIGSLVSKISGLVAAIKLAGGVMAFLAQPIIWIPLAIGAVVLAIGFLIANWDSLKLKIGEVMESIKLALSIAISYISNILSSFWETIKLGIMGFAEGFRLVWDSVKNTVLSLVGSFTQFSAHIFQIFGSIKEFVSNVFESIGNKIKTIFNGVVSTIISSINGVIEKANNFSIKGVSLKTLGITFPKIPMFADGVRNFGGGMAIVGEEGPELVHLPKGSNVYSNKESTSMLGATTPPYVSRNSNSMVFAPSVTVNLQSTNTEEMSIATNKLESYFDQWIEDYFYKLQLKRPSLSTY